MMAQYFIWHDPKKEQYNYGTKIELNLEHLHALDHPLTVLHEFEKSEIMVVKKIVSRLNAARKETQLTLG